LNKALGVTDAEFVHNAGFIGGAWSLETAIMMAEKSMEVKDAKRADWEAKRKIE